MMLSEVVLNEAPKAAVYRRVESGGIGMTPTLESTLLSMKDPYSMAFL